MSKTRGLRLTFDLLQRKVIAELEPKYWRLFVECCLLASHVKGQWKLPPRDELTWRLRWDDRLDLVIALRELVRRGILEEQDEYRFVVASSFTSAFPNPSGYWKKLRQAILERDDWVCQYCGAPAAHVDHVIPRRQNGSNEWDNLVACCQSCNLHKHDRTPEQAGMRLRHDQS